MGTSHSGIEYADRRRISRARRRAIPKIVDPSGLFRYSGIVKPRSADLRASQFGEIVQHVERCCPEATGRITASGPAIPSNIPSAPRDIRQVLLGWEPTSLASGIARTIAYYRSAEGNA